MPIWVMGSGREAKEEDVVEAKDVDGVEDDATIGTGVEDEPEEADEWGSIWL